MRVNWKTDYPDKGTENTLLVSAYRTKPDWDDAKDLPAQRVRFTLFVDRQRGLDDSDAASVVVGDEVTLIRIIEALRLAGYLAFGPEEEREDENMMIQTERPEETLAREEEEMMDEIANEIEEMEDSE